MSGRLPRLRPGDRVRAAGIVRTVVGWSGTLVLLTDEAGLTEGVRLVHLLSEADFAVLGQRSVAAPMSAATLDRLPDNVAEQALWWERQVLEVIHGLAPNAPAEAVARPGFDPAVTTVTSREKTKAAELRAAGHAVTWATVKRQRQRYESGGVAALVDHRLLRQPSRFGRIDERVVEAVRAAVAEATDDSTRTGGYMLWRARQILDERHHGLVAMPSQATSYRLLDKLTVGLHTTGSARTRRSVAAAPPAPFSRPRVFAPGELMEMDSTPLDVLVLLDDGTPGRVELTGVIDVGTKTVPAAVLRPSTKSVDASILLARTLTPEPMRPGWTQALAMSRSVLPHRRLAGIDERLEHAAARPVIVPETIVVDQGSVFLSRNFRSSCAFLGINFQPTHPGSPAEKPHVEKLMSAVGTLFAQYVSGYAGSNTERRGRGLEAKALWSMLELQELLDEWIVACWQNRPHDGLRDPATPGRMFTPNEKYAALVESTGYLPVPLSGEDYIALLPTCWKAINAYGIKHRRRTYDAEQLNPLRRQPSGNKTHNNLWQVHHDPYDVSRIWVRDPGTGGWITAFWTHLRRDGLPFGELAWDHVRAKLPDATEAEIAEAVQALLRRANQGPEPTPETSKRDRRVRARTHSTAQPAWPRPEPPAPPEAETSPTRTGAPDGDDTSTEVLPLGVFDPYLEATKRW